MTNFRPLVLIIGCLLASIPAWAGSITETGKIGKVIYREGQGAVNGFLISNLQLIFGSEDLGILNERFAFTTGNLLSSQSGNESFDAGGHFIVRGCVASNGDGSCGAEDIRGTLITGTFLNGKLVQENGQWVLIAELVEHINPALAALLHEPTTSDAMLQLSLSGDPKITGWTVDGVTSGSISLLSEPASVVIFTASLIALCLVFIARRSRQRAARSNA
jgi:hypothetical protein